MSHRPLAVPLLAGLLLLSFTTSALAQSPGGSIRGRVTDSTGAAPLAGAEVYIVTGATTTRGGRTSATGQYTIAAVPAGTVTVRARLVGYAPRSRSVTVADGQVTTADFALTQQLTQLDQVVVTGTGGSTQRRAVGNVIETISATDVLQVAPARSVEQLIGARTPGLIVLPATGQVGTGAQLRVRGTSSLSLSNDPIIYIDGVRMDAD